MKEKQEIIQITMCDTVKNCTDMPIFHRLICAENATNKPLSDKRNCIRRFLLRFLEQNTFSEWRITMAAKTSNLYARIEPEVKEEAESILAALGIPASNAINMFYKQIILNRGIPFEVKIPPARPVNVAKLSETELDAELEKGYADMTAGKTKPATQAFADIRRDYGI